MATAEDVISVINSFAPEKNVYADDYDNIGLMLGDRKREVKKLMCCLDLTRAVANEAAEKNAEMIITHHPLIWSGLKSITTDTPEGKTILLLSERGISIYSAHTNLDFSAGGINDFVAQGLGLRNLKPLIPYISEQEGAGRIGDLNARVYAEVLKGECEQFFSDSYVRITGEPFSQVKRIAIVNGGGGEIKYLDLAIAQGADCFITADVKHHVAVYARERGLTIIEPQHYNMEHVYLQRLAQILKIEIAARKLKIDVFVSQRENNPRF